jgi:reactive intermediate/imine deaminase
MSREVIAPDNVFKARGYSHAFKVGNTIYVAGQAPFDQDMRLVGKGDIVAQAELSFENLKRVLQAAGATMADIVMLTYYFKNIDDLGKTGGVLREHFQRPYPPATALEVSRLVDPDQLIEVDAIAVVE